MDTGLIFSHVIAAVIGAAAMYILFKTGVVK